MLNYYLQPEHYEIMYPWDCSERGCTVTGILASSLVVHGAHMASPNIQHYEVILKPSISTAAAKQTFIGNNKFSDSLQYKNHSISETPEITGYKSCNSFLPVTLFRLWTEGSPLPTTNQSQLHLLKCTQTFPKKSLQYIKYNLTYANLTSEQDFLKSTTQAIA